MYNFYFNQNQQWELRYRGEKIFRQWWNQTPEQFLIEVADHMTGEYYV